MFIRNSVGFHLHYQLVGDNLNLAWHNDKVQHKGFVPLKWLKEHGYPDEKPIKIKHEIERIKEVSR